MPLLMRSSHSLWRPIMSPQSLTVCQRSLTTMQIQIQGLLRFSAPLFPTAQVPGCWGGLLHSAEVKFESLSARSRYAERPSGDPATPELHRLQRAPAHSSARLPWAAQGKGAIRARCFFIRAVLLCGGIKLSTSPLSLCAAHRLTWLD